MWRISFDDGSPALHIKQIQKRELNDMKVRTVTFTVTNKQRH